MKQLFFFLVLLVLPASILLAMLYSAGRYLYSLYEDKRELKQLDDEFKEVLKDVD